MWTLVLVYACLCLAAIFIPQAIWPSGPSDGASVPWRPAPTNYIVVWTLLCALLCSSLYAATTVLQPGGRRWDKTPETVIRLLLYCALLCCIGAWSPLYHRHRANGVTVFLWMLLFLAPLLVLLARSSTMEGTIALATLSPLVVWVLFQLAVNIKEVDNLSTAQVLCY
jgi:tryptophan-rich sensory protein